MRNVERGAGLGAVRIVLEAARTLNSLSKYCRSGQESKADVEDI